MAITTIKIHPAIGIARLGNSPGDFFIGPEIPLQKPDPAGGFKDAQCKVKRQAAQFRLFAYDENGALVQEITGADADITWTVHLANKKAVRINSGPASDLTIDPGSKTLNGPDQRDVFDGGNIKFPGQSAVTVALGEIRTDMQTRLLVLGG
ncbi:MAG TPA: LodA/GoxA family CTQ-dependent oxidase, partial [Puia sp.]|nr:LodA/GoxA family CTQ-dependent oxidase [Puia sp.]